MKFNNLIDSGRYYFFVFVVLIYIAFQFFINFMEWIYLPFVPQLVFILLGFLCARAVNSGSKKNRAFLLLLIPLINEIFFGLLYFKGSYPWGISLFNGIVFSIAVLVAIFKDRISLKGS